MKIELKTFTKFKKYHPTDSLDEKGLFSVKDGTTVTELLDTLGIPANEPKLIVINGVSCGVSQKVNAQTLKDGDVVAILSPATGG